MPSYAQISKFLTTDKGRFNRLVGYAGLTLGVLLLLCAVQMYFNVNSFIGEKEIKKSAFDYVSITKLITDQNMTRDNRISDEEISKLKEQPFIIDAAPLIGNQFRAQISAGNIIPFSTDLFLEAIDEEFIDTVPETFAWREGNKTVPIILSADYLELYNIFAPAQELPQLSENSIKQVNLMLHCSGMGNNRTFTANIVGLSNRISTILVPKSFLIWANNDMGDNFEAKYARVFIKSDDISNPELVSYIDKNGFQINKEKTRSARIKLILQSFVTGIGIFSLLVILLSMMLFGFYLQLMIARSKDNLTLLQTLGYSPNLLAKMVSKRWIPVYLIIISIALIITSLLQVVFSYSFDYKESISPILNWQTFVIAGVLALICIWVNGNLIKKELHKL